MTKPRSVSGGCTCGAIRYEYTCDPVLSVNCHCRDCQRTTGSGYAPLIIIWKDDFRILSGAIKYHTKLSDAGNTMQRGFCPECGSTLTLFEPHRPKLMFIHAASLDEPAIYKPTMDIFTSSSHSWDAMNAETEKHARMPPIADGFGS